MFTIAFIVLGCIFAFIIIVFVIVALVTETFCFAAKKPKKKKKKKDVKKTEDNTIRGVANENTTVVETDYVVGQDLQNDQARYIFPIFPVIKFWE